MTARRPITICGIDPGSASGALAFYCPQAPHLVTAEDLPLVDGNVSGTELRDRLLQLGPDFVVLERVSAMPKQGVTSTFNFGTAFGIIQGVVAGIDTPLHFVRPSDWKKHFGLDSDKDKSRALAMRLWPSRPEQFSVQKRADAGYLKNNKRACEDRAEAALIAKYGCLFIEEPLAEAAE